MAEDPQEGMQETYGAMILQAEKRLERLKELQRVAIQNFEIFTLDYTDMINGFSTEIESAAKVLHHLHSMAVGRPPPMQHQEAVQERDEEQERLRKEFERGERAPGFDKAVVPPERAVKGEVMTTWSYIAGSDWSAGDKLDGQGKRHVRARLCVKGHPNAFHKDECLVCRESMNVVDLPIRLRVYDMVTGKLLSDDAEPPAPETENGVTP